MNRVLSRSLQVNACPSTVGRTSSPTPATRTARRSSAAARPSTPTRPPRPRGRRWRPPRPRLRLGRRPCHEPYGPCAHPHPCAWRPRAAGANMHTLLLSELSQGVTCCRVALPPLLAHAAARRIASGVCVSAPACWGGTRVESNTDFMRSVAEDRDLVSWLCAGLVHGLDVVGLRKLQPGRAAVRAYSRACSAWTRGRTRRPSVPAAPCRETESGLLMHLVFIGKRLSVVCCRMY
jgi:hypothetical protein